MRDAAHTAENFSNWFSRVNNLQNIPVPPMFNESLHMPSNVTAAEQKGKKRKLSGDEEGKKRRPVKERKPKDVNAPKRPPSAYLLFQNEVRKDVKAAHPEMPHNQLLTEISKLWATLNDKEKEVCWLLETVAYFHSVLRAFST
jgi:transcriptional regulator HMO1